MHSNKLSYYHMCIDSHPRRLPNFPAYSGDGGFSAGYSHGNRDLEETCKLSLRQQWRRADQFS
jgi:hypothetical protein